VKIMAASGTGTDISMDAGAIDPGGLRSIFGKVKRSLAESAGDIVFGMADGTISIFGLVFGVAASSTSGAPVLLAGATGAVAAAVSMGAGVFLDVQTSRGIARAALARERKEIEEHPEEEMQEILERLGKQGFSPQDARSILAIMKRTPDAMLQFEVAFELKLGDRAEQNPIGHAVWMFVADLFAASIPVLPFALFPLDTARAVSLALTTALLLLLGVGRGLLAHTNLVLTVFETLAVATAAAAAGVLISKLLGVSISG
jgi:vacuolar iron transporter family protein